LCEVDGATARARKHARTHSGPLPPAAASRLPLFGRSGLTPSSLRAQAIRTHPEQQGLQRTGCETLANVAAAGDPDRMVSDGAIEAIVAAMQARAPC
jgi:hypothetical protein